MCVRVNVDSCVCACECGLMCECGLVRECGLMCVCVNVDLCLRVRVNADSCMCVKFREILRLRHTKHLFFQHSPTFFFPNSSITSLHISPTTYKIQLPRHVPLPFLPFASRSKPQLIIREIFSLVPPRHSARKSKAKVEQIKAQCLRSEGYCRTHVQPQSPSG